MNPGTPRDVQLQQLVITFLQAIDQGGYLPGGESVLDLFTDDAIVTFPKWGVAHGKDEIGRMFADLGGCMSQITHHYATIRWLFADTDLVAAEGTSHGVHRDGQWGSGDPSWSDGRWCDVFEFGEGKIRRCSVYLDPDYVGGDVERYPWLRRTADIP